MNEGFFEPFRLSLQLAFFTTLILFIIGIPLAYYLSYSTNRFKILLQVILSMPLVLPPSVLGFYLLLLFSPNSFLGKIITSLFDTQLAFSFAGILIGSIIFNFPFMVNSLESGFSNLPSSLREASYSLGKSSFTTLRRILLPNIKPALLTGICLTFAHTIGEFGVILMIGGSIPGKTRVASLAVYDEVQALNLDRAQEYSLYLFLFSFIILTVIYSINKDFFKWEKY